jgi:hypothetical protein
MKDEQLDDLFAQLSAEESVVSYDRAARKFLQSSGVGLLGIAVGMFLGKRNPFIYITMTASTLLVATLSLVYYSTGTSDPTPHASSTRAEIAVQQEAWRSERSETVIYKPEKEVIDRTAYRTTEDVDALAVKPADFILLQTVDGPILQTADLKPTNEAHTRIFWLTRNMDDHEMRAIEEAAEAAGIDFGFRILVWNGRVKKCTFWMNYEGSDGTSCGYQSELKGNFKKRIGWVEDANGQATALITN